MDVINIISKTHGLPDAPVVDPTQYYQPASMYFANGYVHLRHITAQFSPLFSEENLMLLAKSTRA